MYKGRSVLIIFKIGDYCFLFAFPNATAVYKVVHRPVSLGPSEAQQGPFYTKEQHNFSESTAPMK